jgi:predicted Fe-S protein YdhL (DUF1289 family)
MKLMGKTAPNLASPCTGVCRLDAAKFCIGCARSRDEIARWSQMNDAEKRCVHTALAARGEMFQATQP